MRKDIYMTKMTLSEIIFLHTELVVKLGAAAEGNISSDLLLLSNTGYICILQGIGISNNHHLQQII